MLTAEYVRQVLDYNPETGDMIWRERPVTHFRKGKHSAERVRDMWNATWVGKIAGATGDQGRKLIRLDGHLYKAHRLIWLWMMGDWPDGEVDHRDLNKGNNRWTNLRLATHAQNNMNKPLQKNNVSGLKGVSWSSRDKAWAAEVRDQAVRLRKAGFKSKELAAAWVCEQRAALHGQFARSC